MKIFLMNSFTLLFCLLPIYAGAQSQLPVYDLSVSIFPEKGLINGKAAISHNRDDSIEITVDGLNITAATFNGLPIERDGQENRFTISSTGVLEIDYQARFSKLAAVDTSTNPGAVNRNLITSDGISLTNAWYPAISTPCYFKLKAILPKEFTAVSEADEIKIEDVESGRKHTFHFPYPLESINLAADRYKIIQDTVNNITILGYFIEQDIHLATSYLQKAKQYIQMYEKMIGPYPYKRFSIVENILPTGYSMPTYTLLGRNIIRLPFIINTSLGHEIFHQWFGNCVNADITKGNWAEALANYLADHRYEEKKKRGQLYRKKTLINYQAHIPFQGLMTLNNFLYRKDFATKAVGYGKGAMVFHMLREKIGDSAFFNALQLLFKEKKFQNATWTDIKLIFERVSGETLDWFFDQWLNRKDIPRVAVKDARVIYDRGAYTISFMLSQHNTGGALYRLHMTVAVETTDKSVHERITISKPSEKFKIKTTALPTRLILDPNYDLMRFLSEKEYPPTIDRLFGDDNLLVTTSKAEEKTYSDLIEMLIKMGFSLKPEDKLKDGDLIKSSLMILGDKSLVHRRLYGSTSVVISDSQDATAVSSTQRFELKINNHPLNNSKVLAVATASDAKNVAAAARKLTHYGQYSHLVFNNGRNIIKTTAPSDNGIIIDLKHEVQGIKLSNTMNLKTIMEETVGKPIIYIGESHTNYEDHKVQLEVIRMVHARNPNLIIGMEMFQKQFQSVLDDYITGRISEKEFLKGTQYFKRWRFNYRLYKEIIEFARANSLRVIALNIDNDIVKKVARGGLDALSTEERSKLPPDMDMSNKAYRNRLMGIYQRHSMKTEISSLNFFQAQIIWDESMAHTIVDALKNKPKTQMVVLAGVGHLMYGSGIPDRVNRMISKDGTIILNAGLGRIDHNIADYILVPTPLALPPSALLGIIIKNKDNRVFIKGFSKKSQAKSAGIKKKDMLEEIDGLKIESLEDIKIALFDKEPGDSVLVKVIRKKLFKRKKKMEFNITLQ